MFFLLSGVTSASIVLARVAAPDQLSLGGIIHVQSKVTDLEGLGCRRCPDWVGGRIVIPPSPLQHVNPGSRHLGGGAPFHRPPKGHLVANKEISLCQPGINGSFKLLARQRIAY